MSPPQVVVIGDATLDVHVAPVAPMALGSDVPAVIRTGPGGQGANLAVRLARQGVAVTLVCALADDAPARMVRAALDEDGVGVEALPTKASGVIVVIGGGGGERTMLSDRAELPLDAVERVGPLSAGWLVLSGYALLQADASILAVRLGALPLRRVLVGCAVPRDAIAAWRTAAAEFHPDLVIANREETAAARLDELDAVVAVTRADGATARAGGARVHVTVPDGPPAVDTTGAGDAFAAGLISALTDASWPPLEPELRAAVARGVTLASAVVRSYGAQARVAGERAAILTT